MRKLFFLIALIFTVQLFGQTDWEKQIYNGQVAYSIKITGLDTTTANATKYSEWLDWSFIDGQTVVYYIVKVVGDDVDSIAITPEGRTSVAGTSLIATALTSALQTANEQVYQDTLTTHTGTAMVRYPEIRFKFVATELTSSTSNGTVYLTIYTQGMDALPDLNLWK